MTTKNNKDDDSMFKSENVGKSKPRKKSTKKVKKEVVTEESPVAQYLHPKNKRKNNPPVGMVDPKNDPDQPSKRYSYDPRLDPQLQWSGKNENSEFDVDTVSLHVHERIDPITIIEKVLNETNQTQQTLFHYFELPENNPSLKNAIEFYKHDQNWSNRLIAGDSLLVMNSLLEKEGMARKVQMIYIDPPYGITYGSNFQPFIKTKTVSDRKDEHLTQEPEMIKAFRDTWELGIHSYLTYLQTRLLLAKELLDESGSCFIQIGDANVHLVRNLCDEIFGSENFIQLITFKKTAGLAMDFMSAVSDYIIWYAKDKTKYKFKRLFVPKELEGDNAYTRLELEDGTRRRLTGEEQKNHEIIPKNSKIYRQQTIVGVGLTPSCVYEIDLDGSKFNPPNGHSWKTNEEGMKNLIKQNRVEITGKSISYVRYANDFSVNPLTNLWNDTASGSGMNKVYVVQTNTKVVERCMLMTTDPGDLVLDPTCGSGTTAFVAEGLGRRWITADSSRIAIHIAKQRLLISKYKYWKLKYPLEGIENGLLYKSVPHITLKSIARNESDSDEILYDSPIEDKEKIRISGPFTVEAVPSPTVRSIDALSDESNNSQNLNETKIHTQEEWRHELLRSGIRGKGGQKIEFSRVESHPTTKWLHADSETKEAKPKRVMISFGPEYAPLEQRQVANAIEESQTLVPKPEMIIFAAMQFDPEAAKDIEELNWPGVTILKAEMNKDLLTKDLKKKQTQNESFWLMGSPDVECKKQKDGKYVVTVNGFDYYNTKTDEIESGGSSKIAMWELDTDYDGRSVYAKQVFFPMEGKSGGWAKLAKTLQAYVDEELITKFQGIESIPFDLGMNKRIAVKIFDDRGIESLKIINLE